MGSIENQRIAKETLEITRNGYYIKDGAKHEFSEIPEFLNQVLVISPEEVEDIEDDDTGFIHDAMVAGDHCEYLVVNMDSFEANEAFALSDRALVMNFANAHHPGGGFINGASAQEESLCRCSTLYGSINSKEAREMYDFNNEEPDPYDSDYMLISPFVKVFRKATGELMDNPFTTSVLTIPAPNLHGLAKGVKKDELKCVMKEKIRSLIDVSGKYMYDVLILGAWGCGAFGHDAKDVAQYFKEVLVEEEGFLLFKKVIFAVYDKTPDQYNYKSFLETFGEHGIWKKEGSDAALVTFDYKENSKDEDGNILVCGEAFVDDTEQLKGVMEDLMEDKQIGRIEVLK